LVGLVASGLACVAILIIVAHSGWRPVAILRQYDGAFYYRIACDPLLRDPGTVAALDNPPVRLRRIAYPVAASLLALGNARLVPWTLLAVNVLSIGAVGALLALENRSLAGSALPLSLAFQGLWISLALSTPDAFALALLLSGIALLRRGHSVSAAAVFLLASLSRDIYLVGVGALAIQAAHSRSLRTGVTLALGQVPAALWAVYLAASYRTGTSGFHDSFSWPLLGFWHSLTALAAPPPDSIGKSLYALASLAILVVFLTILTLSVYHQRHSLPEAGVIGVTLLSLTLFARESILGYFVGFARAFVGIYVLSWMMPEPPPRVRSLRSAGTLASAVLSALFLVNFFLNHTRPDLP